MLRNGVRNLRMAALTATAMTAMAAMTALAPSAKAVTPELLRLDGPDRVATAIAVANAHRYFNSYAVIASANAYPDALAGAALAAADQAPLYLTPPDHLDPRVLAQFPSASRSNVMVMLLGTSDALSDTVVQQLKAAGFTNLRRLGGSDRYATAAAIARDVDSWIPPEYAGVCRFVLATGDSFADAVAAGWLSYSLAAPLLYTDGARVPAATTEAIEACYPQLPREYLVVGGPAAAAVPNLPPAAEVTVYSGKDRYDTSARVLENASAQTVFGPASTRLNVSIATGLNWPDALAGSTLGPVVLADPNVGLSSEVSAALHDRSADISVIYALGGTDVLPSSVAEAAQQAASTP